MLSIQALRLLFVGHRVLLVELSILLFQPARFCISCGLLIFSFLVSQLPANPVPECSKLHEVFDPQCVGYFKPRPHLFVPSQALNGVGVFGVIEVESIGLFGVIVKGV